MDSSPVPVPWSIFIVLFFVLILIAAICSATEAAVMSINKNRLKNLSAEGNKKAKAVLNMSETGVRLISMAQTAILFCGFLISNFIGDATSASVGLILSNWKFPFPFVIARILITLALLYVFLVFGMIFPKRVGMQNAEQIAFSGVGLLRILTLLSLPLAYLVNGTVSIFLRIFGKDNLTDYGEFSEEEIKSMLEVGQETGKLNESGKEMINSIFEFDDKVAYEVMTPRTDVYSIDIHDELSEYLDELLEERYSRIPVYDKDNDDIIGVLFMKDFMIEARKVGFEHVTIRPLLQKPFFVPESKKINDLFNELQLSKMHMAVLIDEYGGFSGIVTMEDIIEEIVGNIDDEYDDDEPKMEKLDESTYLIDGQYDLEDLSQELGIKLESDNHETIGGFVIELIGEIPDDDAEEEKVIEYENCVFKIETIKDRRVDKIKLYILPKSETEE